MTEPKIKCSLLWYFARWVVSLSNCITGLIGVLTLGFWTPMWDMHVQGWFLDLSSDRKHYREVKGD